MIKSLIQLIPFGFDESARVISGFYIANVGQNYERFGPDITYNYVVGYFEKASRFSKDAIAKVLFIKDWDNKQSTFALMQKIYSQPEQRWWHVDANALILGNLTMKEFQAIEIFKQRAKEDGIFVEDDIS